MSFSVYKCPVCGGTIQIDSERAKCFCMYCGNEIEIKTEFESVTIDGIASLENTLKRAEQFLQMRQFDAAHDYFSRALVLKPDCARAFVGQILADNRCYRLEQLTEDIRYTTEYRVAYECANKDEKEWLKNSAKQIRNSFEEGYSNDKKNGFSIESGITYNLLWAQNQSIPIDNTPLRRFDNSAKAREPLANWDYFKIEEPVAVLATEEVDSTMDVLPYLEECLKVGIKKIVVICNIIKDEPFTTFILNSIRNVVFFAVVITNNEIIHELGMSFDTNLYSKSIWDGKIVKATKAYVSKDKVLLVKQ